MKTQRARGISALALVGALMLAPTLAGCSVNDIVNGAVEKATGGKVAVGTGKLPSDWPKEVPVVDGEILFGAKGGDESGKGWIVTIKTSGSDAIGAAKSKLEDAGFSADETAGASAGTDGAGIIAMKNDDYAVLVTGSDEGLVYAVTPVEK
jgi:hypothetical protein